MRFRIPAAVGGALVLAMALAAPGLPATARAADPDLVVSTGRRGGSYYYIGQRLKTSMLVEQGSQVEILTSLGSLENLKRLDDPESPVGVTLTQADALRRYLALHPEFLEEFIVLGDVGRECVFIIAGKGSEFRTLGEFVESEGAEISLGDRDSGAAVTFESMAEFQPRLRSLTPVFVDTMEALLQLKVGAEYTKLEAAMVVQRPRRISPPIGALVENPDDYRLVAIGEGDVPNTSLPDGSAVYSFENVTVAGTRKKHSQKIDTLCTRGLMLASKEKLDKEIRARLAQLMLESSDQIVGLDE